MVNRQALIEDVLDHAGERLSALGWLLTGSDEAAAELVRDGLAAAFGSLRAPRTVSAAEDAARTHMARIAARGSRGVTGSQGSSAVAESASPSSPQGSAHPASHVEPTTPSTAPSAAPAATPAATPDGSDASLWAAWAPSSVDEPPTTVVAASEADAPTSPEPVAQESEGANPALASALIQMDPRARVAVVLADVEGLPPAQIAKLLRSSTARVEADLAHGRAMLAPVLGIADGGGESVDVVSGRRA